MTIGHTAVPYVRIVMDDGLAHEIGATGHSVPRRSEDNAASQVLTPGAVAGEAQSVGSAGESHELEVTTPLARILSHKTAPTYRCPDCDGPFSYRFRDEDTGCSYPVDDGEHYCARCDAIWTDEYLADLEPTDLHIMAMRAEVRL